MILSVILATGLSAQIKVITSGGFAAPLQDVLPEFEKTTGITVTVGRGPSQGTGPNTIGAQLRRGEPADVVIMSREGLNELIEESENCSGDCDEPGANSAGGIRACGSRQARSRQHRSL